MTKDERDKICKTCKNHITDERYGILCGLTNNISNFQDECKDYTKFHEKPVFKTRSRTVSQRKEGKSDIKSFFGAGISLFIIFKLILFLIKFFTE